MVVGSEESSDPERNEDEPAVELGEKLINITLFTGSDGNQPPGVHAQPPVTLQSENGPTLRPSNARSSSPLNVMMPSPLKVMMLDEVSMSAAT